MKTLQTFLIILTGSLCFSQLQPFTNPEFGKFEPRFLLQGYLIGNNYTANNAWNGIHKLNLETGETTQFTFGEQVEFVMPWNIRTTQAYQDDIYLGSVYNAFRKISVDENYVYDNNIYGEDGNGTLGGDIFKNRVYWFSTWHQGTFYYNLDDDTTTQISGFFSNNTGPRIVMFFPREDYMLSVGSFDYPDQPNGILKVGADFGYEYVDVGYFDPDYGNGTNTAVSSLHMFPLNGRLIVNNRELCVAQMNNGDQRIISIDPYNLENTVFLSEHLVNGDANSINFIVLADGVIFRIGNNYYKTDGISPLEQVHYFNTIGNFENEFRSASLYNLFKGVNENGNSFIQIGDVTYFKIISPNYLYKIYKLTSINGTPELVFSSTVVGNVREYITEAIDWNGNLVFLVESNDSNVADKIYLFNGTELILNPDLNAFSGRTMDEQPAIIGLFSYGDLLLVNTEEGVYGIAYDEMSVSQVTENVELKIYPNPAKDILYFSEKLREVSVHDLSGKLVKFQHGLAEKINIMDLPKGIYIISGTKTDGSKIRVKFISKSGF